ncbi:MAG: cellulase family glycosylhydrolase [Methylophilaceae bacterium]
MKILSRFLNKFQLSLMLLLIFSIPAIAASNWQVSLDDVSGLPKLVKGGGEALNSSFVFFDKNYVWAYQESKFKINSPSQYQLSSHNSTLGFTLNADISKVTNHKLTWDFELDAKAGRYETVGGGISYKFDLDNFGQSLGEPEILADKSGWAWGRGNQRIEMRFEPKPENIFYEKNNKNEIRVYLYQDKIPKGVRHYKATLTLADAISIAPTLSERFGTTDQSDWIPNIIDWKTSPVDLSFLNAPERPAGKRGFVKAKGEQLVFEDGTVAKFWGTNISAFAIFGTPKDNVKLQAKRLSELGFNLVRVHHFDSLWVNPNIFGTPNDSTQKISAEAMDKIDWWIKCLKDEGIYVWLDLHVERHLKSEDGISNFSEISKDKISADLKGYNYVNPSIQKAMQDFNAAYVGHVNPYTGTRLTDEPAVAAMLITNENDVTNHFGNNLLADKNVPEHNKRYMEAAEKFAKANNLPAESIWHSWEHGPSKLFLNNLEHQFNSSMIKQLRELGVKVPIVTTSAWGNNPLSALPALSEGDMIDAHAYQPYGALENNPIYAANITHWLSAAQVVGKPMSVTEWNAEPFPLPDRHSLPMYIASHASMQGWDAMMQYAYSQEPLTAPSQWQGRPSNWHAYNDPALLATMPAAALMYRRQDIPEANTLYVLKPEKLLFDQNISPSNSVFIRTASELGKLQIAMPSTKALPWLQESQIPNNAKVFSDPNKSLLPADAQEVTYENKAGNTAIKRNWDKGYSTIDTPRTQAAMGWIGGEQLKLNDVEISSTTRNATIVVQSLDDTPIKQSKKIYISLAARSVPRKDDKLPFLSEPVEGEIKIKAIEGHKLTKKGNDLDGKEVKVTYKDGYYVINLDKKLQTYWLVLEQ